jgi:PAS domain S-box-containing protein
VSQTSQAFDSELVRLFDQSLDLSCIAGFDGYLRRVNPAFERVVGYTQEELLARPFMGLVHPDDLKATRAALSKLATGNDIVGFENRLICTTARCAGSSGTRAAGRRKASFTEWPETSRTAA